MTTLSGLGRSGAGIKSIQRGVTTPTGETEVMVTVTAVNPAKSMLNLLSSHGESDGARAAQSTVSIRLASATTIGIISYTSVAALSSTPRPCSWELIEFE